MKSKSNGFFILVALLVLGYLHLLVMYAQRIDSSVIRREDVTNNEKPVTLHSFIPMSSSSSSSSSTQLPINIMISQPRLDAQQVKRQMEVAYQTVPPLVKRISGHAIPTVLDTALQIDDPRWRSERILYIITPTHNRMTQMVDLQRLQQTLRLASVQYHTNIYWILIEDADVCSQRVRTIAEESGLAFAHKAIGSTVKTSSKQSKQKTTTKNNNAGHHRGLKQRNLGLETVLEVGKEGVVYFADDDNGYHVQLFTELLFTRHTSIFAVGMSGGSAYERCHVNPKTGTVDAILTTWSTFLLLLVILVAFVGSSVQMDVVHCDMRSSACSIFVTTHYRFHQTHRMNTFRFQYYANTS